MNPFVVRNLQLGFYFAEMVGSVCFFQSHQKVVKSSLFGAILSCLKNKQSKTEAVRNN